MRQAFRHPNNRYTAVIVAHGFPGTVSTHATLPEAQQAARAADPTGGYTPFRAYPDDLLVWQEEDPTAARWFAVEIVAEFAFTHDRWPLKGYNVGDRAYIRKRPDGRCEVFQGNYLKGSQIASPEECRRCATLRGPVDESTQRRLDAALVQSLYQ
jgi:hypothetical protein